MATKKKATRAKSASAKSGSAKSGSAKSGSAKSGSAKSGSAKSGSAKSGSAKSGSAKSASAQSASAKSTSAKSASAKSASATSASAQSASAKPASATSASAASTSAKPAAGASPAESWARIERWFAAQHPALALKLRPGASDRAIAAAEKKLGVTFPDDFRASLRVHDGQDDEPGVRLWPWGQRLGSLDSLTRCWKDDRGLFDKKEMAERFEWLSDDGRVRQVHLHPAHVPIAGSKYWDYSRLLLDFVPGPKGTAAQVIARDDVDFVFVSATFAELLERTARGLEDGTIAVKAGDYDSALEYRTKSGKPVPASTYFG